MPEAKLDGKAAVVTGGSRGIGLAVAESLLSEGVDVVICGRSVDELSKAREGAGGQRATSGRHGRLESVPADVRDPAQMESVMARAEEAFGHLDILINNAGVGRFANLADLSVDDWRDVLDTNLSGVFFACHAAIPRLKRRGGGWIINISSLAGNHPFVGGSAYCASKAGLNALSEVLMQEVRHDDIRVSCVAPGSVDTRFGGAEEASTSTSASASSWKLHATDVARVVVDLLKHDPRSLPSRVEIRPSRPRK